MPVLEFSRQYLDTKINLDRLPAGHYQLIPDSSDTYVQLAGAIGDLGLDCLFMPPIVTDYLVSDSVLREAAFDLENRGITGTELAHKAGAAVLNCLLSPIKHPGCFFVSLA